MVSSINSVVWLITIPLDRIPVEHEAITFLTLEKHPTFIYPIPARLAWEKLTLAPPVYGGLYGKTRISEDTRFVSAWVVDSFGICGVKEGYRPETKADELYRRGDSVYLRAVYSPR